MKRLLSFMVALFTTVMLIGQVPESINYQAVLRDASGNIRASTSVDIDIVILQGSATGTQIFIETHSKSTNEFGLVNMQIGSINTSSFQSIDWTSGPYFVKVIVDDIEMGTSQLLSVPYALHAQSAETANTYTETDPVYISSDVSNILAADITNWDNAYSWGNHSTFGYLTSYTETDPVFIASPANGITATNITNWNAAYSWGNHSGLYKLVSYVPSWNEITNNPFNINTPLNNQLVKYNTSTSKWENWTPNYLTTEIDGSVSNEIQTLAQSGTEVTLSNGGGTISVQDWDTTYWKPNLNGIYYLDGNIGIGLESNYVNALVINKSMGTNDASAGQHDTQLRIFNGIDKKALVIGCLTDGTGFIQANEVNVGYQNLLVNPLWGNVGIGTTAPQRTLHVKDIMRLEPRNSAPSSPSKGDIYFDGTLSKLRVYDGTTWQNCW